MGSTSERPSNEPTDRHYQGGPGEGNDTPQAVLPPAVQSETGSSGMRFHFALHATWLVVIRDFPEEDHPHPWGSHPVGLSTYYETSHPDRDRGKSGQTDHVRGPDGVARGSARSGADTSGQGTGATRWTFPVASTRFAGIADRSKLSPWQIWRPALPVPPTGPPPSELRRAIRFVGVVEDRGFPSQRAPSRPSSGPSTPHGHSPTGSDPCWDPDHRARGDGTPIGPRSLRQVSIALTLQGGGADGDPSHLTRR